MLVRRELGPDAAVLHTRRVRHRWLGWLAGQRQIEVTASRGVNVPSRLPAKKGKEPVESRSTAAPGCVDSPNTAEGGCATNTRSPVRVAEENKISQQVQGQLGTLQAMVKVKWVVVVVKHVKYH